MPDIRIHPLPPQQVALVYPLVREVIPGLTLPIWLRFARRATTPRRGEVSGIMVARWAGRPYAGGLFCYRREIDLALGPVLVAEHIVALDILDPEPILAALVGELDQLARRLGCNAIRSIVRDATKDVATGLIAAGHRPDFGALSKPVARDGVTKLRA